MKCNNWSFNYSQLILTNWYPDLIDVYCNFPCNDDNTLLVHSHMNIISHWHPQLLFTTAADSLIECVWYTSSTMVTTYHLPVQSMNKWNEYVSLMIAKRLCYLSRLQLQSFLPSQPHPRYGSDLCIGLQTRRTRFNAIPVVKLGDKNATQNKKTS